MSTRHLFLPFLIALAGIVSCNQLLPDDQQGTPRGYVTVDKQHYCNLTNVKGKDFEGNQKWVFYDGNDIRVKMSGWRCRCGAPGHISFNVSLVELDLPGVATMYIPLERTEGDHYVSGNKSVAGAHLNHYHVSKDGRFLEFDLSITLYRETKGDIRIFYSARSYDTPSEASLTYAGRAGKKNGEKKVTKFFNLATFFFCHISGTTLKSLCCRH